jgi:hypothetical protein
MIFTVHFVENGSQNSFSKVFHFSGLRNSFARYIREWAGFNNCRALVFFAHEDSKVFSEPVLAKKKY